MYYLVYLVISLFFFFFVRPAPRNQPPGSDLGYCGGSPWDTATGTPVRGLHSWPAEPIAGRVSGACGEPPEPMPIRKGGPDPVPERGSMLGCAKAPEEVPPLDRLLPGLEEMLRAMATERGTSYGWLGPAGKIPVLGSKAGSGAESLGGDISDPARRATCVQTHCFVSTRGWISCEQTCWGLLTP
jgi:hypothetical protein